MWALALGISANVLAEDYSVYSTGGYPLVSVTVNISEALDYCYEPSYSSIDSSILLGLDSGYTNPLFSGMGYGTGIFGGDLGCALGYCSSPYTSAYDPSLSFFNPLLYGGLFNNPMWNYPPFTYPPSIFPGTFPTFPNPTVYLNYPQTVPNIFSGIPSNPNLPSGSGIFTTPISNNPFLNPSSSPFSPPTGLQPPPYGACDDVFVPCPMGPVTRTNQPIPGSPSFNPAPGQPIFPGNPQNPLAPTSHIGQTDPNRGQVPRGARPFFR
jgi:hypothetical protein